MEHREIFTQESGLCRYVQCSCGNAKVIVGKHALALGTAALKDLTRLLKNIEEKAALLKNSPPPPGGVPDLSFDPKKEWMSTN